MISAVTWFWLPSLHFLKTPAAAVGDAPGWCPLNWMDVLIWAFMACAVLRKIKVSLTTEKKLLGLSVTLRGAHCGGAALDLRAWEIKLRIWNTGGEFWSRAHMRFSPRWRTAGLRGRLCLFKVWTKGQIHNGNGKGEFISHRLWWILLWTRFWRSNGQTQEPLLTHVVWTCILGDFLWSVN